MAPVLATGPLRWTLGLFCGFVGALALVAPHQFKRYPFEAFRSYLPLLGVLMLATSVGLLAVAMARPHRRVAVVVHALAGIALFVMAVGFARGGGWSGTVFYVVLGLGAGVAPFLPSRSYDRARLESRGDLLSLLLGVAAVVSGLLHVLWPGMLQNPFYDQSRSVLPWLGLAFLAGGGAMARVQLRRPRSTAALVAAHLAAGAAFFTYGAVVSAPGRIWTGLALYWGCGGAVALLPWLRRRLSATDPRSLGTRFAFVFAVATAVALILTVAVVTSQEELLSERQVRRNQRFEAQIIARNVADYIELNGARTAALATLARRLPPGPAAQRRFLERALESYPDVTALALVDGRGLPLAEVGRAALDPAGAARIAAKARGTAGAIDLDLTHDGDRPMLLLGTRVGRPGPPMILMTVLDSASLARRIARPGSRVSLADGRGLLIASEDGRRDPGDPTMTELPAGWDAAVRQGRNPPAGDFAAFARVKEIGWVVAVEQSRAEALAGVRRGRDMALVLLLLVAAASSLVGIIAAQRVAGPLASLASAVGKLTAGDSSAPLPRSDISEVERLAASFGEMRDRLAARTRESERLATELEARAAALADADRRKDEFLAMLAHELRNPLGAIANASYLLAQRVPDEPVAQRAVAILERQTHHLVRMVDDLLDVSRITRGKVELRREPVDLAEVVAHAVEAVRPLIEERRHQLALEMAEGPLPLSADATRLEQVFTNLLRNAARYTEPGGRIAVAVERDGGGALVRVADSGIGIAPDLLPRIFDLFTQGAQALDRSGGGLGIGLTLVHRLVELHGGRVEARSEGLGHGSEFRVWLPLAAAGEPAAPLARRGVERGSP